MSKKSEKIDNRNSIRIESGSRNKRFKAQYLFLLVLLLPLTNSKKNNWLHICIKSYWTRKTTKKKKRLISILQQQLVLQHPKHLRSLLTSKQIREVLLYSCSNRMDIASIFCLRLPHFRPSISVTTLKEKQGNIKTYLACVPIRQITNQNIMHIREKMEDDYSMCMPPLSDDGNMLPWSACIALVACSTSCIKYGIHIPLHH